LFHEEHDLRETQVLNNVYDYSIENEYNQGFFLIGVGHRNSVTQKIAICQEKESPQLLWTYYC
jgi:stage III sporulation protein SpoIIIAA